MDSLFITILNNAIVASWLIAAIILLRLVFKKVPKWVHCMLWILVAVKLLLPINIETPFGFLPKTKPIPEKITVAEVPTVDTGISGIDESINFTLAKNMSRDNIEYVTVTPMGVYMYIASLIWLTGIIIMLAYFIISFLVIRHKVSASIRTASNTYECDEIVSPFILGLISPKIYLPSGLDARVKECVIAHENVHISRRDYLWKPLGFVILAIYWFNPLCWISYILLCRDIEYACDEKTTKDKEDSWRADYCQALLDCSVQKKMITACPVAFGEVSVKNRIKKVLDYKKPAFWFVAIAIVACLCIAVCFMTSSDRPGIFESTEVAVELEPVSVSVDEISEEPISMNNADIYAAGESSVTMLPEEETVMAQIPEGSLESNADLDGEDIHNYYAKLVWPTESSVIAKGFSDNDSLPEGAPEGVKTERISIVAPVGTPVYSASSGTVIDTGFDSYDGNYIEILSDDGFHFGYYHLDQIYLNTGDNTVAGNEIGTVGNTGSSTGPHLGFSMGEQQGSEFVYLDPLNFF